MNEFKALFDDVVAGFEFVESENFAKRKRVIAEIRNGGRFGDGFGLLVKENGRRREIGKVIAEKLLKVDQHEGQFVGAENGGQAVGLEVVSAGEAEVGRRKGVGEGLAGEVRKPGRVAQKESVDFAEEA